MSQSLQNTQQTRPVAEREKGREIPDRHASNEGGAVDIQEGEEGQQSGTEIEPTAKRIKIDTTTSGEGSTPAQGKSVDIPFDVWLMIGEHLEPLDLVHLTRVNKSLRRLLRSKSDSARVWKLAFKNVNLPTLKATDWDLVYLASFCFEDWACFGCGASNGIVARDFPSRIFVHEQCRSNVFSTATEVSDLVEVLHPDTLSCVASWSTKEGRKLREFYIPSEVKAMNGYLHHLDSTTTASRDRQVRKAAREARDDFIASKKKCVEARFDDASSLRLWLHPFQLRQQEAVERRRRAEQVREQEERAFRLRARLSDIRARLLSLGHAEKDLKWLGKDLIATRDQVLTNLVSLSSLLHLPSAFTDSLLLAEWNEISSRLHDLANAQKMKREASERAAFEANRLSTYYSHFDQISQLSLVCSMQDFAKLPAVNQLIVARSSIGDPLWQQVVPSLQRRIDRSRRNSKLSYARPLAHALNEAGHPLPQQLFDSFFPPGASSTKPAEYWRIPSKLNLASQEDVASPEDGSTISDAELDALLSRFTSRVFCGYLANRHQVESFRKVVDLRDQSNVHSSGVSVSAQWIKILFSILKVTGIEDGEVNETLAKVDALGNVWRCQSSECSNYRPPFMALSGLLTTTSLLSGHSRSSFKPSLL